MTSKLNNDYHISSLFKYRSYLCKGFLLPSVNAGRLKVNALMTQTKLKRNCRHRKTTSKVSHPAAHFDCMKIKYNDPFEKPKSGELNRAFSLFCFHFSRISPFLLFHLA